MDVEYVRLLYDYDRWANRQMMECVSKLTQAQWKQNLGSSYRSVCDTVVHILAGEWIWLERWKGTSPTALLNPADFPDVAGIRQKWSEVQEGQSDFLGKLDEEFLRKVIAYVNTRGESWKYPLWQMMVHLVNHSTYHRGQVMTMVRQLGGQATETDFLVFFDQMASDQT